MLKMIKNLNQIFRRGTVLSQKPVSSLLFNPTNLQQQNSIRMRYNGNPKLEDIFFKSRSTVDDELNEYDDDYFGKNKRTFGANKILKETPQKMVKRSDEYFRRYQAFPPLKYDTHIPDITENILKQIGDAYEIANLSPGTLISSSYPIKGYIFGFHNRMMVPLNCQSVLTTYNGSIVRTNSPILKVWFLINTSFNSTFVNETTFEALKGILKGKSYDYCHIKIDDPKIVIDCHKSRGNFKEANVLGLNFFEENKVSISDMDWCHRGHRTFQLVKNE